MPLSSRPVAVLVAVALTAAACSSADPTSPSTTATTAPAVTSAPPITAAGRLLVLDDDGGLVTTAPDGTDPVVLATAATGEQIRQPVWSPDGTRIAWVRVSAPGGTPSPALEIGAVDGTAVVAAPVAFAPFYLSWDPTSTRVGYLGNGPGGIEFGFLEGGRAEAIDRGQPYYFSWEPGGERLLAHIASARLDFVGIDGTFETLDVEPAPFNAPVWAAGGGSLVYAAVIDGEQRVILSDADGGDPIALARYEGRASLVLDSGGRRLAVQSSAAGTPDQPAVAASAGGAAARLAVFRQAPPLLVGLTVIDLDTGAVTAVTTDFAAAFFWSPDGRRLLSLHLVDGPDRTWFRWRVWEDGTVLDGPRFLPSRTFASEYLAFFDQYAQSMTPWSPDGDAFVYAGTDEDGIGGIWVQPVADGAAPVRVGGGTFASWSP